MGKIPSEMVDIVDVVRRECRTFDDLVYMVSVVRTRPYSRLAAIVDFAPYYLTLKDYCRGIGEAEVVRYVRRLGVCGRRYVVIYRGGSDIRAGDWVALERRYAELHGTPVYSKVVPLEDVVWAGTDVREWYYVPRHLVGKFKNLKEFWDSIIR